MEKTAPTRTRKQIRQERKKEEILEYAVTLLREIDLNGLSLQDIAGYFGLTKNALYYYFASKDALLLHLGVKCYEILTEYFERAVHADLDGLNQVTTMGNAFFEFAQDHPGYQGLLHHMGEPPYLVDEEQFKVMKPKEQKAYSRLKALEQKFVGIWLGAVQKGMADGTIRNDLQPEILAMLLGSVASGVLFELGHREPFFTQFGLSKKDVIQILFDIMRNGMGSPQTH